MDERVFNSWAALRGKVRTIYMPAPIDKLRKSNGDQYEPNSLASMQAGIDSYVKENNYVSIIRDSIFDL